MSENIQDEALLVQKYYYSINTKGFYVLSDMGLYATIPSDLNEIRESDYLAWCNPPEGYYQVFDDKGPRLEPIPAPDYNAIAASNRKILLDEATLAITVWQTKLLMARKLTDAETTSLNAWMDYIDVLNDTDISDAPDVQWPIKPTS